MTGISFADLTDTFSQSRDNGERRHDAIDIIAPRGTPVVSATAGRVEKLFYSQAGGNTVYVRSPDGNHIFYYAHLDTYAPGLQEDAVLAAGEPIGTVGSTGNADDAVPHLHFAVWATDSSRSWSDEATPINPYPLLAPRGD